MTHPLFEGSRELARRFRKERRARSTLAAEEFLAKQQPGAHYPADIARAQWVELLDVVRNASDKAVDGLITEWLDRQLPSTSGDVQATMPLDPGLDVTLPTPAGPVPAQDAQFIDRRYRIERVLGEGAFGKVFLVKDKLQNDHELALKLIKKEHTATSEALVRFKNEILLLRVLNHPGIPQIFNDGISEDGEFYYTMAYVAGRTLDDVIRKEAPLDPTRIVRITKQVLDVLDYAHAQGAIHRDLKPGNIFLLHAGTPKEQVRVLDFGIAKVLSREGILEHAQTMNTEMPLGTPHYMSPEQVRGKEVDGRTDLYALGVIIYQMCSGRFPFSGKTLLEILSARLEKPPNPLEDKTTPEWLRDVVMKLLERERDKRPDTQAIRVMLDHLQVSHRSISKRLTWISAAVVVIAVLVAWSVFGGGTKSKEDTHASVPPSVPAEGEKAKPAASESQAEPNPENPAPAPGDTNKPKNENENSNPTPPQGEPKPDATPAEVHSQAPAPQVKPDPSKTEESPPPAVPFSIEVSEPAESPQPSVPPEKKTLHISGRATRKIGSAKIGGQAVVLNPSDPMHFEAEVALPTAPMDGKDEDRAIEIELIDTVDFKSIKHSFNYRQLAARIPVDCTPANDALVDERGRVTSIRHGRTGIALGLVDEGPGQPGFYFGLNEVTKTQLEHERVGAGLSWDTPIEVTSPGDPAVSMSLDDAQKFCELNGLRLPTIDEWDRAAQLAGHIYPWGDEFLPGACNSSDAGDAFPKSAPVGKFPLDKCGPFFDMAGNVSEWCLDSNAKAALRGGSWKLPPNACKLGAKNNPPSKGSESIGFRVALTCKP